METLRFDELNLSPQILRAVKEMGFEEASPIQGKAIPVAMTGADIIGQAQTGTGKTAAFGIPVLEKVKRRLSIRKHLFSARRASLRYRQRRKSGSLQNICMA